MVPVRAWSGVTAAALVFPESAERVCARPSELRGVGAPVIVCSLPGIVTTEAPFGREPLGARPTICEPVFQPPAAFCVSAASPAEMSIPKGALGTLTSSKVHLIKPLPSPLIETSVTFPGVGGVVLAIAWFDTQAPVEMAIAAAPIEAKLKTFLR